MSSIIPRYQHSKQRTRPPPLPNASKPAVNLSTKPGSNVVNEQTVASHPRPPPIPKSPRPVHTPALRNKRSVARLIKSSSLQRPPSPQQGDDYTIAAISDDQRPGHTAASSHRATNGSRNVERDSHSSHGRVRGLGLGVKIPNIPPTPTFDSSRPLPGRIHRGDVSHSAIPGSPMPAPSTLNVEPSVIETSPYSDISHEIDRIQTEFLTPKFASESYAFAARKAIADSQTPPFRIAQDFSDDDNPSLLHEPELTRTESEGSSIEELRNSNREDVDSDELSNGAANLFRELSIKSDGSVSAASSYASQSDGYLSQESEAISETRSSSHSDHALDAPRSHLMASLRASERSFITTLREALNLFVLPLRLRSLSQSPNPVILNSSSPGWIDGLPAPIGRLFDWLEDIVVVHERLSTDLNICLRMEEQQEVDRLETEDVLLDFVACLEVYQGYLVRCEAVIELIEELVGAPQRTDFGEFVALQSKDAICERSGRNLPSYLRLPIARLSEYPVFFMNLLDVTRHSHPSYITTLALYHSCNTTIEVLYEVKQQEEEYQILKHLEERIDGLQDRTSMWRLARRERRLIAQGLLKMVIPVDDDGQADRMLSMTPRARVPESPRLPRSKGGSDPGHGGREWDYRGHSSAGSTESEWPQSDATAFSGSTQYTSHPSPRPRANSHSRSEIERQGTRELPVYIFVFEDFVMFTLPGERGSTKPDESLTLMRGIGVSKVLTAIDVSSQYDHEHLISLDVLPVIASPPGTDAHVTRVYVSLPERMTSRLAIAPASLIVDARKKWLAAFKQCNQHTIRSLSYPKDEKEKDSLTVQRDFQNSLDVIRQAGLPMPKSPSQQLIDQGRHDIDIKIVEVEGEREERGFWALRFQMVMKEKRRGQMTVSQSVGKPSNGERRQDEAKIEAEDLQKTSLGTPGRSRQGSASFGSPRRRGM